MTKAGQSKWATVLPCKQLKRKLLQGKHIMPSVPGAINPSFRTTLLWNADSLVSINEAGKAGFHFNHLFSSRMGIAIKVMAHLLYI